MTTLIEKLRTGYDRSQLMDLAEGQRLTPGFDMLVNLPQDERVTDIRLVDLTPSDPERKGRTGRGLLCTTTQRLLFFLRVPFGEMSTELATATGYLVECLLRNQPLNRERAARFFPKREAALVDLRRRMARLYFLDLMPVLSMPLAGIPALMGRLDTSQMASVDIEVDLRAEGGALRRMLPANPVLRFVLGPRLEDKSTQEPPENLPLVSACPLREMVEWVDWVRDCQAELPEQPVRLFSAPWALALLASSPKAKASLVFRGEKVAGGLFLESGQLMFGRKLVLKDPLFNVGEVEDLGWDEPNGSLSIKGPGLHYNLKVEGDAEEFAWLRAYLEELLEVRRSIWEDPLARRDLTPEAKPDPVGEMLRYHLEPCNDPLVFLKDRLDGEMVDEFMADFGQLIPPEEAPQGLVAMGKGPPYQDGMLFTERAIYARKPNEPGHRIPYGKLDRAVGTKKGLLSTSLQLGPLAFKLDTLGKETARALLQVLREVPRFGG